MKEERPDWYLAVEILKTTNDGQALSKYDLHIVELAVNDKLSKYGREELVRIHRQLPGEPHGDQPPGH